jgi:two-component system, chemotaxis family, response regulator Rcp1
VHFPPIPGIIDRLAPLDLAMARENEGPFHILITDDDPAFVHVLRRMLKNLSRSCELHWAKDGLDALDFLHRRNSHREAPTPHIILMDVDMPRMNGLRALRAIRNDAALSAIPVIVLSGAALPAVVRASYLDHANAFVRKTVDLDRLGELLRAIEAFWMRSAVLPPPDALAKGDNGISIASSCPEVEGCAMQASNLSASAHCAEHHRLMTGLGAAVKELLALHEQQFQAIVQGDAECNRFDLLIHMANEKKQEAKYAYLRHVESHGCSNIHAAANASGT